MVIDHEPLDFVEGWERYSFKIGSGTLRIDPILLPKTCLYKTITYSGATAYV